MYNVELRILFIKCTYVYIGWTSVVPCKLSPYSYISGIYASSSGMYCPGQSNGLRVKNGQ